MFEITNFSYMNMYNYVCCRTRASLLRVHGLVLALFNDEQNCLQGIHCSQRGKGWASRSPIQVIFWWLRFLMVMMVQWWGKNQIQIKTCWKICLRLCFSMYFKCLHGSYMCWSMQVNIFPRLFVSKVWVICRNFLEKRLSSVQIYNEITVMETINKCLILLIPGLLISTRRMSYSLRISWSDWQH